jgi:dTDP-4-dehydrorhamnose reductase
MTEKPFVHKSAFTNVKTNFMFHEDVVPILFKLLDCKGIINIGGKKQTIYNFAKESNKKVKKALAKKNQIPLNSTLDLKKMQLAIKKFKSK